MSTMPPNELRDEPLDAKTNEDLQDKIAEIIELQLSERARALALTNLYTRFRQNSRAVKTLEELIGYGNQTPALYFYLGEIYESSNLQQKARENYEISAQLASEVFLLAKAGLARLEADPYTAARLRQEAKDGFTALKNTIPTCDTTFRTKEQNESLLARIGKVVNTTGADSQFIYMSVSSDLPPCNCRRRRGLLNPEQICQTDICTPG